MKLKKEYILTFILISGGALLGVLLASRIQEKKTAPETEGVAITKTTGQGKTLADDFYYNIDKFKKVDPALIKWKETGEIFTGLKGVNCIFVDRENVFVGGEPGMEHYSNGKLVEKFKTDSAIYAMIFWGDFFMAEKDRISAPSAGRPPFGKQGKDASKGEYGFITSLGMGQGYHGVKPLFVADSGNRVVYEFSENGKYKRTIKGNPRFVVPSPHLAVYVHDETLYVSNPGEHKVERYTLDGKFLGAWGRFGMDIEGFSGCCNPVSFFVMKDGRVVTAEKGLPRIKVYSPEGKLLEVVAGPESFNVKCILSVADGEDGRIYALDSVKKSVRIFERKK